MLSKRGREGPWRGRKWTSVSEWTDKCCELWVQQAWQIQRPEVEAGRSPSRISGTKRWIVEESMEGP